MAGEGQQVKDSFIINNMDDASKNDQGQIGWVMEPTENAAAPPTAPFATPASTPNVYASADSTSPPLLSSEPSSSVGLGYSSASTAKLQDDMKRAQAAAAAENQPETPRTRSNLKRHPYLSEIEPLQKTKDRRRLDKERNKSWKEEDRGSSGDGMKWRCTVM
uniref:Uncharacterized protein n=1 Tax=Ditylenchus dipsaci TaxID=166011 RepID=A0A915D6H7_9BILA